MGLILSVSAADTWLVREDGVGPVKIGMALAQLGAAVHERLAKDQQDEGACFYVAPDGHGEIACMIKVGRLVRIDVDTPGITAASGLQVGDF